MIVPILSLIIPVMELKTKLVHSLLYYKILDLSLTSKLFQNETNLNRPYERNISKNCASTPIECEIELNAYVTYNDAHIK